MDVALPAQLAAAGVETARGRAESRRVVNVRGILLPEPDDSHHSQSDYLYVTRGHQMNGDVASVFLICA